MNDEELFEKIKESSNNEVRVNWRCRDTNSAGEMKWPIYELATETIYDGYRYYVLADGLYRLSDGPMKSVKLAVQAIEASRRHPCNYIFVDTVAKDLFIKLNKV